MCLTFRLSAFCWTVSAISWFIVSTGILLEERPIFKSCFCFPEYWGHSSLRTEDDQVCRNTVFFFCFFFVR